MVTLEEPDFDLHRYTYWDEKERHRVIKEDTPPHIRRKVELLLA